MQETETLLWIIITLNLLILNYVAWPNKEK